MGDASKLESKGICPEKGFEQEIRVQTEDGYLETDDGLSVPLGEDRPLG
jgi:hypothetical protein